MPAIRTRSSNTPRGGGWLALLSALLLASSGCHLLEPATTWNTPEAYYEQILQNPCAEGEAGQPACVDGGPAAAEVQRLGWFASVQDSQGLPECVDAYFDATVAAYGWMTASGTQCCEGGPATPAARAYHAALGKLIASSQRHNRYDPHRGVQLVRNGQEVWLPIRYEAFPWSPDDFNRLDLIGSYSSSEVKNHYRTPGLGVCLVGVRRRAVQERFFAPAQSFPVTAVLLPDTPGAPAAANGTSPVGFALRLYNPLECTTVATSAGSCPLAGDLTAPLVWQSIGKERQPLIGFLHPDDQNFDPHLFMLEPYQPHKIPVVFVHGLLSSPLTWASTINDLRANPGFRQRYQAWVFRYPTGKPVLGAGAALRREVQAAAAQGAGSIPSPSASRVVLVGHSMGGLVSKLQVSSSQNLLWESVARQPLESLIIGDAMRAQLADVFYFEPNPVVGRVVYIGTPHRGSAFAHRLVGRIGSELVRFGKTQDEVYKRMICQNPCAFLQWVRRRFPTSIDLLEPGNPLLVAIGSLPVAPGVHLHSIIGTGRPMLLAGPADGVVPVSSAQIPGVDSELYVPTTHTRLHHDPATIAELLRIFEIHAQESGAPQPVSGAQVNYYAPNRRLVLSSR